MNENIITSVQNTKIKQTRSLKQKQERDTLGIFAVEGAKVIDVALNANLDAQDIFVLDTKIEKFQALVSHANDNNIPLNIVNEKVLYAISQTKSPQGIVATFNKHEITFTYDKIASAPFIAILEEISDPGNLGTIIRTCDAVGADMIIMSDCADIYNPKVIRASMGSIFNIPCYDTSLDECLSAMVCDNWQIGCGHLNGENFYNRMQKPKVALVIGNESRGIKSSTSKLCTHLWKLPMNGKAESLNASIAAGIMLYDIHNKMCT